MSSISGMTKPLMLPLTLPTYTAAVDVNGLASSGGVPSNAITLHGKAITLNGQYITITRRS